MDINYIGVEGAKLDSYIENYENVMSDFNNLLKSQTAIEFLSSVDSYKNFCSYKELFPGNYPDFSVKLDGVYENGLVFEFEIKGDAGPGHYNDLTSALLFVNNNSNEFNYVISYIDARVNEKCGDKSSYKAAKNENIIKKLESDLGKRIDRTFYVGYRKPEYFLTKSKEKKRAIFREKIQLLLVKTQKSLEEKITKDNKKSI